MLARFSSTHYDDADGNPAGGRTSGTGLSVVWQDGPLGRGEKRIPPNGAFVETVIAAAKDRIEYYQRSKFACAENAEALEHLQLALDALHARTQRRDALGIEGTHATDIPCDDCELTERREERDGTEYTVYELCESCAQTIEESHEREVKDAGV